MKQLNTYITEAFRLRDDTKFSDPNGALNKLFDLVTKHHDSNKEIHNLYECVREFLGCDDEVSMTCFTYMMTAIKNRSNVIKYDIIEEFEDEYDELLFFRGRELKKEIQDEIKRAYRTLKSNKRVQYEYFDFWKYISTDLHVYKFGDYVACILLCDRKNEITNIKGILVGKGKILHEAFRLRDDTKIHQKKKVEIKYHPSSTQELRQIIIDKIKKYGPGTKDNPIDFNDIDVRNITSFSFKTIGGWMGILSSDDIEHIDISGWDVSNTNNLDYLFKLSRNLKTVKMCDTSNIETMFAMFYGCTKMEEAPTFHIDNCKDLRQLFYSCTSLKTLPLFSKKILQDASIANMLMQCRSLNWDMIKYYYPSDNGTPQI